MVTKTIVFSPFARLEGDLQVQVDIEGGQIVRARASGTLYRGFEPMLRGRTPMDALVFTCRVCGQCGLAHSAAASGAIRALSGATRPANAAVAENIMMAVETVLSHLTQFYFSFAPDLLVLCTGQEVQDAERFQPPRGQSCAALLRAREQILGVLGLFAGKWPNTLALQPGGTTRPVNASEIRRCLGLLAEFTEFVAQQMIGCELERWLTVRSGADLDEWMGQKSHAASDLGFFVDFTLRHGLDRMGAWPARFISSGGWRGPAGAQWTQAGFMDSSDPAQADRRQEDFTPAQIVEHVRYSWYDPYEGGLHPFDGETEPAPDRTEAYSWAKAPRYAGQPAEAGPLARLAIDRDGLVSDLLRRHGPSAFVRELARVHETLRLLGQVRTWLSQVDPEEPFCCDLPRVVSGSGAGLVEAPRGVLGHWLRVEEGTIRNYQIITPTGWNLSPRDSADQPGPLEVALVGTPVPDPDHPATVSYVVKSFDPCLFCTVH